MAVRKKKTTRKKKDDPCPQMPAYGSLENEFPTTRAGAVAAARWVRERRAWITDTFVDFCDKPCPVQRTLIQVSSTAVPGPARRMRYRIDFRVICDRATGIGTSGS